jgi:Zn-dependent peptidase ImmA (M78 family)
MATVPYISTLQIENLAIEILFKHDLFHVPVNPVQLAEKEGIKVFDAEFEDRSISGVLRKDDGIFQIYVNSSHSIVRKRYTIAHELGHFYLHKDQVSAFIDPELNLYRCESVEASGTDSRFREVQANKFAAALLMPAKLVGEALVDTRDIDELAAKFLVSCEAMGIRINSLGL